MQHCYEDKNTEECKDDAQRDLRGDNVARRPLRHLEGVRRLRGEDEHGNKRHEERTAEACEGDSRAAFMTPLPAAWRSPSRRGWRRKRHGDRGS